MWSTGRDHHKDSYSSAKFANIRYVRQSVKATVSFHVDFFTLPLSSGGTQGATSILWIWLYCFALEKHTYLRCTVMPMNTLSHCCAVYVLSHFSHVWLSCNTLDCSLPGSFVHGILQVKILEWVAMTSSRGSSWPRDQNCVSYISCVGRQMLYH